MFESLRLNLKLGYFSLYIVFPSLVVRLYKNAQESDVISQIQLRLFNVCTFDHSIATQKWCI